MPSLKPLISHLRYHKRKHFGQLHYYGLADLDRRLEAHLPQLGGFFIEAGANDGIMYSNTAFFERHKGWRGILIEPIPELAEQCMRNRPRATTIQAALGSPEQAGTLVPMTWCNFMSIVDGAMGTPDADQRYLELGQSYIRQTLSSQTGAIERRPYKVYVPVITLSAIIERYSPGPVDLLSLDIEGLEAQALGGLDLERHGPRAILVECLFHEDEIRAILAHYDFIADLGTKDLLFKKKATVQ